MKYNQLKTVLPNQVYITQQLNKLFELLQRLLLMLFKMSHWKIRLLTIIDYSSGTNTVQQLSNSSAVFTGSLFLMAVAK